MRFQSIARPRSGSGIAAIQFRLENATAEPERCPLRGRHTHGRRSLGAAVPLRTCRLLPERGSAIAARMRGGGDPKATLAEYLQ